ncbi:MAG: amino acid adenylation domain-containing protein [Ectothiorhodospiraceae bacterium]|nr:amino acid adenylation domain-containing protein [Ectothiorhodospiraceae bacterium]
MTTREDIDRFVARLRALGASLWLEGEGLGYEGPPETITDDVLDEMVARKAELVAWLSRNGPVGAAPAVETGAAVDDGPRPIGREAELPLSFAQSRLWFLTELEPGSAIYNLPLVLRLRGPLDAAVLGRAIDRLVARHESLRTRFVANEGRPVQVVDPPRPVRLAIDDLRAHPVAEREAAMRRLVEAEIAQPFDVAAGPVLRARLVRLADEENVFVLVVHHLVSDGWSSAVVLRELAALYHAERSGSPDTLPPLRIQYADYAAWQREWLQGERLERHLRYWREHLTGAPALEMPADRRRVGMPSGGGASERAVLPASVARGLDALSRTERVTPFMILLSAFYLVLQRHARQDDLVVGTPIANRNRAEIEDVVGFFVNMLPLRADLSGAPTVRALLRRVKRLALDAYAHQDVPFETIVEALEPDRDLTRNPIFQIAFSLQSPPSDGIAFDGVTLAPEALEVRTARFDLEMHVWRDADRWTASLVYANDLFDAASVRGMLDVYGRLVEQVVERPDAPIDALELGDVTAGSALVAGRNATATDYPRDATIDRLFEAVARERPDVVAMRHGERSLTYRELESESGRVARWLTAHGVGPDVPVGVLAERSPEMIVTWLAVLRAGGAYVPLDPEHPPERLAFMLEDVGAPVLVAGRALLDRVGGFAGAVLRIGADGDALPADDGASLPRPATTAESLAYIVYTSGSTGRPKGVAVPHRGVVRLVRGTDYLQLGPEDVVAQISNASFDAATFEIWGALLNGGRLEVADRDTVLSPQRLAAFLGERGVSALFLTTALFNQVVREVPGCFAGVGTVLFGGEAADPAVVRRALAEGGQRRLLNVYGPTESTTFASWHEVTAVAADAVGVPIGIAIANTRLHVLDARMRPVPVGVPGELLIGGDGLARGYWNRPELTAERFVEVDLGDALPERLYRTGDLVRRHADGALEFLGRIDHQVKIRGFRVELGEIESCLRAHEAVAEAVVLCREDTPGDRRLVGYYSCVAAPVGPPALRDHLRRTLPAYMVPTALVQLDAMPLNPNGKIDRAALPAPAGERQLETEAVAPRDDLERRIAAVWGDLLGIEHVGVNDSFFDLGGNSLLLVRIRHALGAQLGREVAMTDLFRFPTVAELASHLGRDAQGSTETTTSEAVDAARDRARRQGDAMRAAMRRRRGLREGASQ